MKDKRNKIIFISVFFCVLIVYLMIIFYKKKSLDSHYKITNAFVYEINQGSLKGGSLVIKYFFYDKGRQYSSGIDCDLSYNVRSELLNTFFPVAYDSSYPSNNVLLVLEKRWDQFSLSFPDSLKWIKKYW